MCRICGIDPGNNRLDVDVCDSATSLFSHVAVWRMRPATWISPRTLSQHVQILWVEALSVIVVFSVGWDPLGSVAPCERHMQGELAGIVVHVCRTAHDILRAVGRSGSSLAVTALQPNCLCHVSSVVRVCAPNMLHLYMSIFGSVERDERPIRPEVRTSP